MTLSRLFSIRFPHRRRGFGAVCMGLALIGFTGGPSQASESTPANLLSAPLFLKDAEAAELRAMDQEASVVLEAVDAGLITLESAHSVATTADRLEKILTEKGLTVFARIDHAAGAEKVGKELRPTQLVIFGNPKVGTPLMQCDRAVAIDLPQKALIWEDAAGMVFLTYNDPQYLARRHNLADCGPVLEKVQGALKALTGAAVKP